MRNILLVVLLGVGMDGCATASLEGRVTRFHALDLAAKSFALVPASNQQDSLEFRSYAAVVVDKLSAHGWHEAPLESADVAVFLQYEISQGRRVSFSYPIFGQVPTGTSTTTGSVTSYGNTSRLNATTTQQTTFGVVGSGTGRQTEFDRAVRIMMYSLPTYRETNKMQSLYEGEIRSTGSTGDLPTVMPALLRGLLQEFPGKSGTAQRVSIPLQ